MLVFLLNLLAKLTFYQRINLYLNTLKYKIEFLGYLKGNAQKYIWRYRNKNGLEDLKKAQIYLGWLQDEYE